MEEDMADLEESLLRLNGSLFNTMILQNQTTRRFRRLTTNVVIYQAKRIWNETPGKHSFIEAMRVFIKQWVFSKGLTETPHLQSIGIRVANWGYAYMTTGHKFDIGLN